MEASCFLHFLKDSPWSWPMHLLITPFYAGLLGLLYLVLTVHIVRGRYRFKSALGDAQQFELTRRIRAHANFAEYAPLFLILLGFAEVQTYPAWLIHGLGLVFLIGRLSHTYSLLRGEKYQDGQLQAFPIWRSVGMVCTISSIAILSTIVLITYLNHSIL